MSSSRPANNRQRSGAYYFYGNEDRDDVYAQHREIRGPRRLADVKVLSRPEFRKERVVPIFEQRKFINAAYRPKTIYSPADWTAAANSGLRCDSGALIDFSIRGSILPPRMSGSN